MAYRPAMRLDVCITGRYGRCQAGLAVADFSPVIAAARPAPLRMRSGPGAG